MKFKNPRPWGIQGCELSEGPEGRSPKILLVASFFRRGLALVFSVLTVVGAVRELIPVATVFLFLPVSPEAGIDMLENF